MQNGREKEIWMSARCTMRHDFITMSSEHNTRKSNSLLQILKLSTFYQIKSRIKHYEDFIRSIT